MQLHLFKDKDDGMPASLAEFATLKVFSCDEVRSLAAECTEAFEQQFDVWRLADLHEIPRTGKSLFYNINTATTGAIKDVAVQSAARALRCINGTDPEQAIAYARDRSPHQQFSIAEVREIAGFAYCCLYRETLCKHVDYRFQLYFVVRPAFSTVLQQELFLNLPGDAHGLEFEGFCANIERLARESPTSCTADDQDILDQVGFSEKGKARIEAGALQAIVAQSGSGHSHCEPTARRL